MKGAHMTKEGLLNSFVQAVDSYTFLTGSRVLVWRADPLSAIVTKGDQAVTPRARLARICGLRLYPGVERDVLALRDSVDGGEALRGGFNAAGSRQDAAPQTPTEG
jgi:hypothetical protein